MKTIQYQSRAVARLVNSFKELMLDEKPNSTIVLKSPTGSGKTTMMAKFLDQLLEEDLEGEYVYIWASFGDLAHQSYEKLSKEYLPDSEYNFQELENLQSSSLPTNTVLFCNWEKMFRTAKEKDEDGHVVEIFTNVFVRIGEDGRNLQEVLEKTRQDGKKIVLIVDEAHRTYMGEKSQRLVSEVIKPNLVLEVSATPIINIGKNGTHGHFIEVPLSDVIESGLIKNSTVINNDISSVIDGESADTAVLAAALKQREILVEKYKKQGSKINPLILIQIPTGNSEKMTAADESTRDVIEKFMASRGITYENGKLAIWVSGDYYPNDVKTATTPNDSPIEVLIFKQAIATGWDCPRASILVMLQDIKTETFKIQTVGRILRMPELRHYDDQDLNTAYVFTNINSILIEKDEDTEAFFKIRSNKLKEGFSDMICWPNAYRKRVVGNRNRLNKNFRPLLKTELDKFFNIKEKDDKDTRLKKLDIHLEVYDEELTIPILADVSFQHLDVIDQKVFRKITGENGQITAVPTINDKVELLRADKAYVQRVYNAFIKSACSPYAPFDSSAVLKPAIYQWFAENGYSDESEVQRIIACSEVNQQLLLNLIGKAKDEFSKTMDKETELTKTAFVLPVEQEFGDKYEEYPASKHILQPYYRPKSMWSPEEVFEKVLERAASVDWWYRNGVSEPKYFGVPYEKLNDHGIMEEAMFYPDYIVHFTDGTIGIFDTKSGDTTRPGTTMGGSVDEKANALQMFMRDYNEIVAIYLEQGYDYEYSSGDGLWGGIVKVATDGHLELQADAITQNMARKHMNGRQIEYSDEGYDPNEWNRLQIV